MKSGCGLVKLSTSLYRDISVWYISNLQDEHGLFLRNSILLCHAVDCTTSANTPQRSLELRVHNCLRRSRSMQEHTLAEECPSGDCLKRTAPSVSII